MDDSRSPDTSIPSEPAATGEPQSEMPAPRINQTRTGIKPKALPDPEADLADPGLYFNRELSHLQFNVRVLEQALDEAHPLLNRLMFLLIFSSNMDEFFEIRVAGLKNQIMVGDASSGAEPDLGPSPGLAQIDVGDARCGHTDPATVAVGQPQQAGTGVHSGLDVSLDRVVVDVVGQVDLEFLDGLGDSDADDHGLSFSGSGRRSADLPRCYEPSSRFSSGW